MKSIEQLDLSSELDRAESRADALKDKAPKVKEESYEEKYWHKVFPETNDPQHEEMVQKRKDEIIKNIENPEAHPPDPKPENRTIRGQKNKWNDQLDYKSRQFKDND